MSGDEVVEKLQRRFGLGTKPMLRKALYQRLGELVEQEGERALYVIATAVDDAMKPGRGEKYFCYVVMRRLIERGVIPAPEL